MTSQELFDTVVVGNIVTIKCGYDTATGVVVQKTSRQLLIVPNDHCKWYGAGTIDERHITSGVRLKYLGQRRGSYTKAKSDAVVHDILIAVYQNLCPLKRH